MSIFTNSTELLLRLKSPSNKTIKILHLSSDVNLCTKFPRSRREPSRMLGARDSLFCRAAFNSRAEGKVNTACARSVPFPFSAPFYTLSSSNRDTLSRLRIQPRVGHERKIRVGALALVHLASPEEVINHPRSKDFYDCRA